MGQGPVVGPTSKVEAFDLDLRLLVGLLPLAGLCLPRLVLSRVGVLLILLARVLRVRVLLICHGGLQGSKRDCFKNTVAPSRGGVVGDHLRDSSAPAANFASH